MQRIQPAELYQIRKTLKSEFEEAFGEDAYDKYYAGVETINGKKTDFIRGFNHKDVASASQTDLKFVHIHPILGLYFMAAALDRHSEKLGQQPKHADLARLLLTDFAKEALSQMPRTTAEEIQTAKAKTEKVRIAVNESIDNLIEDHMHPRAA